MEYTANQKRAIDEHGSNLLVSAAAGSGKTAVLVERIIQEILRAEDPIDIDTILVMTFTKAAASEMRERILTAINKELKMRKADRHLQKQATLVHNAHISTIHGFCLDVIRNHFHVINLSPDFRALEEAEAEMLKREALTEVLEEFYERSQPEFIDLTEHLAVGRDDSTLEEQIMSLYKFVIGHADPEVWLSRCVALYRDTTAEQFDESEVARYYFGYCHDSIDEIYSVLQRALEIARDDGGPFMYVKALENDLEQVEQMMDATTYSELISLINSYKAATLGSCRDKSKFDEELKEYVKGLRDYCKKVLGELKSNIPGTTEYVVNVMHKTVPDIEQLELITRAFIDRFAEKKRKRNAIDFNDMEHMCLEIFRTSEAVAQEYRSFFREIYVDEYQDSNLVQEEIVNAISNQNVFMVGDVKQSIYGFRNARPDLFLGKYDSYISGQGGARIDLHDNFRSRPQVVDSVNEVFYRIMKKNLGGIEYDEAAELKFGATCYGDRTQAKSEPRYRTELIVCEEDPDTDKVIMDALVIAKRIQDLMKEGITVFDKRAGDEGGYRPLKYSDIAILLMVTKGVDEVLVNTLYEQGIPAHAESSTGYFSSMEISSLISFLKVIDNPYQDIPLAAAMKSPLGRFTDEELAMISGENRKKALFYGVSTIATDLVNDINTDVIKKTKDFYEQLNYYRDKSAYTSVYEILREIIDGSYGQEIMAMQNGETRFANLNLLLDRAVSFGKTSYKGLFQFVRYLEYSQKHEIDYGGASLLNENDNTVRIMSIHKSKGLEFPIVFLAQAQHQFNRNSLSATLLSDPQLGIGIDLVDAEKRTKRVSFVKQIIKIKKRREMVAEELRLFYVAMTRAREKLIVTSICKTPDKVLSKAPAVAKCLSHLDFLMSAQAETGFETIDIKITGVAELIDSIGQKAVSAEFTKESMISALEAGGAINGGDEELNQRLTYEYSRAEDDYYTKKSVTELKKRSQQMKSDEADADVEAITPDSYPVLDETFTSPIPEFISKTEEIPANLHGTAFHRILEIWDYTADDTEEAILKFLGEVAESLRMEKDLIGSVTTEEIGKFLRSDVGRRMKAAALKGELYREQPFMIHSEEGYLVQGIIDAFFIEDGRIVVVDYKTDRVRSMQTLVNRYKVQLDYYEEALTQLMKMPVSEKLIYSSRMGKTVSV